MPAPSAGREVDALHRLLTAERIGRAVELRLLRGREVRTMSAVPSARP